MRRAIERDRFRQARVGIAAAAPVAPAVLVLAAPPKVERVTIALLLPRLLGGKSRGISHARGDRLCCLCCRLAQWVVSFPVFPPPLRGRAGRGVSSLRGAIATKQSRAELGLDCFAPLRGARNDDIKSRSRDASQRPSYDTPRHTLSDSSPRGIAVRRTASCGHLCRWSMLSCSRQTLGGKRLICFTATWIAGSSPAMTRKERTKKIRRRNADIRNELICRALRTRPRLKREAHIYRRSTAVLVPRSLSSQGTQHQAFASWDVANRVLLRPLSGRYPPLPVPVQRSHRAPVVVPRG
jgi:hypothetical protein